MSPLRVMNAVAAMSNGLTVTYTRTLIAIGWPVITVDTMEGIVMISLREYYVTYEYVCWKCPETHQGTATIEGTSPQDAQERFENETTGWDDWPGVDGWDYDTKVIGVSWRP